jgi:hypothetical protein
MIRSMFAAVAMYAATGCSGTAEPASKLSQPEAFAGVWRSVTPSLEFLRLSVDSKSSEMGVLAARLTFSGVAWEGGGRIEGDSLVARMGIPGSTVPSGVIVARARDAQTLRVQLRPAAAAPTDLTFVREN